MPKTEHPNTRILSVSYDDLLLRMRQMILENEGYVVVSAHGLENGLRQCKEGGFDLFILGHSIPDQDKRKLVEAFQSECPAPIISLTRGASEQRVDGAGYHLEPDPERLLKLIAEITHHKARLENAASHSAVRTGCARADCDKIGVKVNLRLHRSVQNIDAID